MKEYLFEAEGIAVYVEDGILYEVTDSQIFKFEDTESNRDVVVGDAWATVENWKENQ